MQSLYRVRNVRFESGERFPLLVNVSDGMPLFDPCVFLVSEVRSAGCQFNTLKMVIRAIKFAYDWAYKNKIDFETRFISGQFLTLEEIDNLAAESYTHAASLLEDVFPENEVRRVTRKKVASLESARSLKKNETHASVSSDTARIRFYYIRDYLEWLAAKKLGRVRKGTPEYLSLAVAKDEMRRLIEARIPIAHEKSDLNAKMGIEKSVEERLLEIIHPQSSENPWKDMRIRVRNRLLIYMLLLLGLRKGEAFGIRVTDVDFGRRTITIHRTPDDKSDPRKNPPSTKTKPRELLMDDNLAYLCREYIVKYRSMKLPRVRYTEFLFVETKYGNPMAPGTANEVFKALKKLPGMDRKISPHILRHTWNDRFSEVADENIRNGIWTVESERKARAEKMGWVLGSDMAERYSRRHIKRQADKALLEMQKSICKGEVKTDAME